MAKTKTQNKEVVEYVEIVPEVKQIIRTISFTGMEGDGDFVGDVDHYLSGFFNTGYKLLSTHVIKQIEDTNPEARGRILGVSVLYVLVKE